MFNSTQVAPAAMPGGLTIADLRCPATGAPLVPREGALVSVGVVPERVYPVVRGVPVLIDDDTSLFRIADFTAPAGGAAMPGTVKAAAASQAGAVKRLARAVLRRLPDRSYNTSDFSAAQALNALAAQVPEARVLVIGAGEATLPARPGLRMVYTDVAVGPNAHYVCDAHQLPFADGSFDMVVCCSVLEHVLEPHACVAEIHRVLRPDGLVYAVTPFIAQVHMGAHDFTRFTFLGHRALFRRFDTLRAGMAGGPGMALTWTFEYWLTSFGRRGTVRSGLQAAARLLSWPVRYGDHLLARREGAYDTAAGSYFFGRRRETPVPARDLLREHRGLNPR
ncbi:methyltransferase domain-containing protein [Caenispirillum salinarum]|uniref:methyltransferase domain-containing protein n=1 Tax=Caenispirillum salinarum TaxID=859058 RepID=UPI00384E94F6